VGYWLGVKPVTWSLLLGAFSRPGGGDGLSSESGLLRHRWLAAWSAVLTALEWHLVWIALSGMETSMFIALTLLYLVLIQTQWEKAWLMGLVGGLLFLTRPRACCCSPGWRQAPLGAPETVAKTPGT